MDSLTLLTLTLLSNCWIEVFIFYFFVDEFQTNVAMLYFISPDLFNWLLTYSKIFHMNVGLFFARQCLFSECESDFLIVFVLHRLLCSTIIPQVAATQLCGLATRSLLRGQTPLNPTSSYRSANIGKKNYNNKGFLKTLRVKASQNVLVLT